MEIDHEEGSKINREELVEINIEERNEIDLEERTEINCEELNETDCDEINVISNERNEGSSETTENGFSLFKVAPYSSGEGLPYAPVDWPLPGDKWRWKVGKRTTATGFFMDRYLYYPDRLQSLRKGRGFASKLSVKQYLQTIDGADVNKFFSSFSWKIPSIEGPGIKGQHFFFKTSLSIPVSFLNGTLYTSSAQVKFIAYFSFCGPLIALDGHLVS